MKLLLCASYLDVSMNNIHWMTVFDSVNDRSDSFCCFFLTVELFFKDCIEKLRRGRKEYIPLHLSSTPSLMNRKCFRQTRRTASQCLDGLPVSEYQSHFEGLACPLHLVFPCTLVIFHLKYFDIIFIATFSPVFLLVPFLTTANDPLFKVIIYQSQNYPYFPSSPSSLKWSDSNLEESI